MTRLVLILTATLIAAPALAQTPSPAPAATQTEPMMPLSQILAKVEAEADFVGFDDIEWDDRDRSWEIEYRGTGGRLVTVELSGSNGEPLMQ